MPLDPITTTPTRGGSGGAAIPGGGVLYGGLVVSGPVLGTRVTKAAPIQIMGLVPVMDCNCSECRVNPTVLCCDTLPVFGNVVGGQAVATSTYENDWNSFLLDFGVTTSLSTVNFTLQKYVDGAWVDKTTLNTNTYGHYYPLRGWTKHPTYAGVSINWGKVIGPYGAGCFRVKIVLAHRGAGGGSSVLDSCQVSRAFTLRAWNCNLAHQTTKFESWKSNKIGSAVTDGYMFDLCGINWYDSIRIKGYFGERQIAEYQKVLHEYPNSATVQIRNMAVPKFTWTSFMLPYWFHERFSIYALMADKLLVSDYNINNSAYNIKQRQILLDGAYKPEYFDKDWNPHQIVKADFNLYYHGIVSSICCDATVIK